MCDLTYSLNTLTAQYVIKQPHRFQQELRTEKILENTGELWERQRKSKKQSESESKRKTEDEQPGNQQNTRGLVFDSLELGGVERLVGVWFHSVQIWLIGNLSLFSSYVI